jgi:hypothetical protein
MEGFMKGVAASAIAALMMMGGVALLVAQPAQAAESAEHPEWKVGDKWTFRQVENPGAKETTWTREVMAMLPDGRLDVATGGTGRLIFDRETNSLDKRGPEYTWRRFKFPMTVGADWKHEYQIAGATWKGTAQSNWRVLAYEKITVPAGTFDCFKVEGETFSSWQDSAQPLQQYNRSTVKTTYWYCPAMKWAAKWEVESSAYAGAPRVTTVSELVSFEHKP